MININKHMEFFNPIVLKNIDVNIIGVGAVGSWIAIQLAKLGVQRLTIWDMDEVDDHNITNQVYTFNDIGKKKTVALKEHLLENNPEMEVTCKGRYVGQPIKGVVFLEVDSMEVRKDFAEANQYNEALRLVVDGRIGLSSGQVYVVDWKKEDFVNQYIDSVSSFTDDEISVPVSACGMILSVSPSVFMVAAEAVAALINYCNGGKLPSEAIYLDAFEYTTRAL